MQVPSGVGWFVPCGPQAGTHQGEVVKGGAFNVCAWPPSRHQGTHDIIGVAVPFAPPHHNREVIDVPEGRVEAGVADAPVVPQVRPRELPLRCVCVGGGGGGVAQQPGRGGFL